MDGPGLLTLFFSESVNVSSLDVTQLTLVGERSNPNAQNYTLTLTPGSLSNSTNGPVVEVQIGHFDLNEIKKLTGLAINDVTTYVTITTDLIDDMNGNPVDPISLTAAIVVDPDGFIHDTTRPRLVDFDLDLNTGELIMTFSETVYGSSLDPSSITLLNRNNDSTQMLTLTPRYLNLPNDVYLTLVLTEDELNTLKAMDDLGTNVSNTYLSILNTTVHDMVENYIVPIPATRGRAVRMVYNDTTPPRLEEFDLDVDEGTLTLVFDETVNADTFNISLVTLQNGPSVNATTEEYTLTTTSSWTMVDSTVIVVTLSFSDLNNVKIRRHLASNESGGNTYLSLPKGTVYDMMGLPLVEVNPDNATIVRNITMDTTQPQLVAFEFNLNSEQITLTFTEAVDHLTLLVNEFIIAADLFTLDPSYNLTMGSTPSDDGYIIVVQMSIDDVNNIKRDLDLAVDGNTTFLILSELAIMDMNENELNFTDPIQVSNFTEDSRPPILVDFHLDMNSDLLVLVFNETVRVPNLMIGEITLQDNSTVDFDNSSVTRFHTLNTSFPLNFDDPSISIHLHPDDINRIKKYNNLASFPSNTYISMTSYAVTDMNGNTLVEISPFAAKKVSRYVRDTTPPVLTYYELDLSLEEVRMVFNETVNVSSLDATQLSISNGNGNATLRLTGGIIPEASNSTHVTLKLTRVDLNEIKKVENLAVSNTTTYLVVEEAFLTDMAGNYISSEVGRPADDFVEDFVPPELESFHLDMNEGLLHLTFDETVRSSTLDPTGIHLLDERDPNTTVHYQLIGGETNSTNDPVVTVIINETDLNNIKRLTALATSTADTFIAIRDIVVFDMNNNSIVLINTTDALQAANFTNDTTSPQLVSFDFDLDSNILTLTFDETVEAGSLESRQITFTNSAYLTHWSTNYTLTSDSRVVNDSLDDTIIEVKLSLFDSNEIKKLTDLATSENDTFLLLTSLAVADMNSNPLVAVETPFEVTNYTEDTTRPILEDFVVDMDGRLLILYFSETVNSSSLRVDQITLQDYLTAMGPSITLKEPSLTDSSDDYMIVVDLGVYDVYELTALTNLYTSLHDSFLTITSDTIVDMNGNRVVGVVDGEALEALDYLPDVSRPMLVNFTVDLDRWIVQLFFDEAIALDYTDFGKIGVFSDEVGAINLTLTNGTFDTSYTHNVTLHLIREDVNDIKVTEYLWTERNNTWLYLAEFSVWDWTANNTIDNTVLRALFDPIEEEPPNLVSCIANMTGGVLVLVFDEPVRYDTIIPTKFSLENDAEFPSTVFNLTGGRGDPPNGLRVVFEFKYEDLNDVKARTDLFTSINDSYLTLIEGAIQDMVYNPSAPITRKQASFFFDDRIMPHLLSYDLDMNEGLLYLSFYETVDVSSFNLPSIRLQRSFNVSEYDEMSYHYFSEFTTASSTITMLDNRHVTLNISLDDLNEIKRKRIATNTNTTWLVMDEDALVDNNNQSLVPLVNGLTAEQVNLYIPDETSPELNGFHLDMNDGTLTLLFDETVDAETLDVTQFTLVNKKVNFTEMYTLTTSGLIVESPLPVASGDGVYFPQDFLDPDETPDFLIRLFDNITVATNTSQPSFPSNTFTPLYTFNSPVLVVYLSRRDLNEVKKLTSLATSSYDTYLSITSVAIFDMVGNNVTAIATDEAQKSDGFTHDITSPVLLSYELDLDSGNLTLTFSETVNVTSLDTTQLTFHNQRNIWSSDYVNYTLNSDPPYPNTSASFSPNDPVVVVQIGHQDLDVLKNIRNLVTSSEDTYLSWTNFTILDMAGNNVVERLPQFGRHTLMYTPDTTPPELISFDLDLDDGRLILTFSETVKIRDTLNVTEVSLHAARGETNNELLNYTFTAEPPQETSSMDNDSRVVMIRISFNDLNAIKYRSGLATGENDTYLSLTNVTVVDLNDNAVVAIYPKNALPVRIHTPDTMQPILVNFTLDMDTSTLILTFNETVNSSSLMVDQIVLQDAPQSSTDYHSSPLMLTPGVNQTSTTSDNDYIVVVDLGPADRNELKRRQNLAIDIDTTHIVVTSDAIMDMNMNMLTAINDGEGKIAAVFIPDATQPVLTEFSIDMNSGHLVLTFDETVNASTLETTEFTLLDGTTGTGTNFTFTSSTKSDQSDNTTILITISTEDQNEIKRKLICRQVSDCYINHNNASVYDMAGNPIGARYGNSTLRVSGYNPDQTRPRLVAFTVNLTSEEVSLTFDETVNVTSLNFTAFTLQDFFKAEFAYTLTGGIPPPYHSTVITFLFSLEDLNEVKRMTTIYTDRTNSWLTFTRYAIDDLALDPNPVVPISDSDSLVNSIVADVLYPDFVDPELDAFELNLTSDQLILSFSETIRTRTFMIEQITLQNAQHMDNVTQAYNLTSSSSLSDPHSDFHVLTINLGFDDLHAIKTLTELATSDSNTFISITDSLVLDMNDNPVVPIPTSDAQNVLNFTEDHVRPRLVDFNEFDLDSGTFVLQFDEPVNVSSFDVTQISIQSSADNKSVSIPLTDKPLPHGSRAVDPLTNTYLVTVAIGDDDLNAIKEELSLARNALTTYFSFSEFLVNDMNENRVVPRPPVRVLSFVHDTTPPHLVEFCLNLTSEILTLTFSESVNINSLRMEEIVLQAERHVPTADTHLYVRLSNRGLPLGADSPIVDIMLDSRDLNMITERPSLATTIDETYISFSSYLVVDMVDNSVVPIPHTEAMKAVCFQNDTVPPTLSSFLFNLNTGILHLTFDETVNSSCFNRSLVTVQNDITSTATTFHTPSDESSIVSPQYSTVVSIRLTTSELNRVKSLDGFATSSADTFVVVEEEVVKDMNLNPSKAGVDVSGNFTADTTRPTLVEYHLDLIRREITFVFDEPIDSSDIDYKAITLQDMRSSEDMYNLTGGTPVVHQDSTVIVVQLNDGDSQHLRRNPSLTTSVNDTFVTFTRDAFHDTAVPPNPIEPLVDMYNATRVRSFVYYPPPLFTSIRPTAGRASGGTFVTVQGGNFGPTSDDPLARRVDLLLDFNSAMDVEVTVSNITLTALTPPADNMSFDSNVTLTLIIDDSALMLNVTDTYRYLPPPVFSSVFPTTASQFGGTLVTISGQYFGPSTVSGEGPVVEVAIGNSSCSNVTVLSDAVLTCLSPTLDPNTSDIAVTVDEVTTTVEGVFTTVEPPVVLDVTPDSTHTTTPSTTVTITGVNFGPLTSYNDSIPPQVYFVTDLKVTQCVNVRVVAPDSVIVCEVGSNLGPANVTVVYDGVSSDEFQEFIFYDDAGYFSFQSAEFFVSEVAMFGNVTVIRHNDPPFATPTNVTISAFDGTALAGAHFIAGNETKLMPSNASTLVFQIGITAASYEIEKIRKGVEDDRYINLRILSVEPLHGIAAIGNGAAVLTIKATCETVTTMCVAEWDLHTVKYYRTDELP